MSNMKGLSVFILMFCCLTGVSAKNSEMVVVKPELASRAVLLAGSQIVAGDLTQNEFFILGKHEAPSQSAKLIAMKAPVVNVQKPLPLLAKNKIAYKARPILISQSMHAHQSKQKKWTSQIAITFKKAQAVSVSATKKVVVKKLPKQHQVISKVAVKSVKKDLR